MKASLVPAAAAVLAACQLQDRRGITDPTLPSNSVVQVVTVPDTVTLEPSQTEQFRVFGRTEAGDSVSDRKSTRLNSSHLVISYAVFCLKKKTDIILVRSRRACLHI